MSLVKNRVKQEGSSPYNGTKLVHIGDKLTGLYVGDEGRNSAEWGDFTIMKFVTFDPEASDLAKADIKLESLIQKTVLKNKVEGGSIYPGGVYQIEYKMPKGTEYTNKKGAKAHAKADIYDVFSVGISEDLMKMLRSKIPTLGNVAPDNQCEPDYTDPSDYEADNTGVQDAEGNPVTTSRPVPKI